LPSGDLDAFTAISDATRTAPSYETTLPLGTLGSTPLRSSISTPAKQLKAQSTTPHAPDAKLARFCMTLFSFDCSPSW
ncbi:hypothetical protein LU646_26470, partial [Pseudomonas alloputida]|uniref:hypothetical protein n=1 Tax=Pseudomonas alloputida TaxID=1940621 RepID=UPI001E636040